MAYSLGERFPPKPKNFNILDPGAYELQNDKKRTKKNAAPFLSRTPRDTSTGRPLWTHAIHFQDVRSRIPNCTSLSAKQPRFPYEAFSEQDLEEILCKCGIINPCDCPSDKEETPVVCQGKVKRRIFKGRTPGSALGDEGLSAPSKNDRGFNILIDGTQKRIRDEVTVECPPFYDARVQESTAMYRGWKWSQRTSKRSKKSVDETPGPADYYLLRKPNKEELCIENVRAFKRKISKQPRLIEAIQRKQMLDNFPGPSEYSPKYPKGTETQFLSSKTERFPVSKLIVHPGPADYSIRRDFDPIPPTDVTCHAILPDPAGFGMKAKRFQTRKEEGPGPATYAVNYKICRFVHCPTAPFGASAQRFKDEIIDSDVDEAGANDMINYQYDETEETCATPTWEFKSKTVRMKPLDKKQNEPSPADFLPPIMKTEKSAKSQYMAPFSSSEGRFRPWYSWIPVHGGIKTPGPATFCLEKPKCPPTFVHGPLFRADRFPPNRDTNPPPNSYNINNGIEIILATHNQRLNNNINNQYKFAWKPPPEKKQLSYEERRAILFQKAIDILEIEPSDTKVEKEETKEPEVKEKLKKISEESVDVPLAEKPKMLRTFLYLHPLPKYL